MIEAYQIANKTSQSSSSNGKRYYDQKMRGVVLKPVDRVVVRNVGERGGPGKLCSYWENKIYVVRGQFADNPVYVVSPEGGAQEFTPILMGNDLPVELPQPPTTSIPRNTEAYKSLG